MVSSSGHTVMLGLDGTLWSFGSNTSGQLGCGTTLFRTFFDQVESDTDWAYVSTGGWRTVAIKEDGSLWFWGSNGGAQNNIYLPQQIGVDTDWVKVAAGTVHFVAIKTDGTLWGWGNNAEGQLGVGSEVDRSPIPIQIGEDTDWANIYAIGGHTMAIKTDGSLWGWGNNNNSMLGDGTNRQRTTPVRIGTDYDWVQVALGTLHTAGVKTDGSLWIWGFNTFRATGDEAITRPHPERLGNDNDWVSVAIGDWYTLALKADGSLWVWGSGGLRFGLPDRDISIPTRIYEDKHWVTISAHSNRAFGITSEGVLHRLGW